MLRRGPILVLRNGEGLTVEITFANGCCEAGEQIQLEVHETTAIPKDSIE
jgi:hypothetical protein